MLLYTHIHKERVNGKSHLFIHIRKECRPRGLRQLAILRGLRVIHCGRTGNPRFSNCLTESEAGLQVSLKALLHSLHLSFSPFLPLSYSFYSLSPLKNQNFSVCWAYFMSVLHINYFLIHNKNIVLHKLSNLSVVTSQCSLGLWAQQIICK